MELERIDVKNVKELDKRCVVCTFQPTLSLNKEWVMSLATMVIAQDFEKIAQLEVQDSFCVPIWIVDKRFMICLKTQNYKQCS